MIVVSLEGIGHCPEVRRIRQRVGLHLPYALLPKCGYPTALRCSFEPLLEGDAHLRGGIAWACKEVRKCRGSVIQVRVDGHQVLMREQEARIYGQRRIAGS